MGAPPKAFSPGSITGFFQPIFGDTPNKTKSKGLAFCVDRGVSASVSSSHSHEIVLNGESIYLRTVMQVVETLAPEPVRVSLETDLPLGYGFGVSAACALSTAFAINRRFDLERDRIDLGMISHNAEVSCRTGLGDVAAQLCGGVVFRHCESGPLAASSISCAPYPKFYCQIFSQLSTREMLSNSTVMGKIQDAGSRAIEWLAMERTPNMTIDKLIDRSQMFANEIGLITHPGVIQAIGMIREFGGSATMLMFGNSVLAIAPEHPGKLWHELSIDSQGTRLL